MLSKNGHKKEYDIVLEYKEHAYSVNCLLYVPQHNLLLSASHDCLINVFSLTNKQSIDRLTGHEECITGLISLNNSMDFKFASSSYDGEIRIWKIMKDHSIECISTIQAHKGDCVFLNLLSQDFMVSRVSNFKNSRCFKIWDLKTFKCCKICEENCEILSMVTSKDSIITLTSDWKLNLWKYLE